MVEIKASLVKELRERTNVSMMECKKALIETNGDLEAAIEILRKAGQAKAVKKSSRVAAEGLVIFKVAANNKSAAIVEVNCETDFVAKGEQFKEFADKIAKLALEKQLESNADSIENMRLELVAKLGENIAVRRSKHLEIQQGTIGAYLHGVSGVAKIATLVSIDIDNPELAKDIAMQVAAMKPEFISEEYVPKSRIAPEKEVFMAQAKQLAANKPGNVLEKIVSSKIKTFLSEITLVGQAFIKDSSKTIEQLLNSHKAKVTNIIRYEVGENIE